MPESYGSAGEHAQLNWRENFFCSPIPRNLSSGASKAVHVSSLHAKDVQSSNKPTSSKTFSGMRARIGKLHGAHA